MIFTAWIERKLRAAVARLRYYVHRQKYQDQKLFIADTLQMPRFWVAMVAGFALGYRIMVELHLDYLSPWIFPLGIGCVLAVFVVLDKLLDWIFPIG